MPAMEGIYYIALNAGTNIASSADYKLMKNDSPFLNCGLTHNQTSNNDVISRDIITKLQLDDTLHLSTTTGVSSNVNLYTAFHIFSLSESMDPLEDMVIFSVGRDTTLSGDANPMPFNVELVNDEGYYSPFSHTFFAPSDGIYFFSFSVGLEEAQGANFTLYKNDQPYINIIRESTTHAGTDIISRSIVLQLQFLDTIHIVNEDLPARSSALFETSFTGFKYQPANETQVTPSCRENFSKTYLLVFIIFLRSQKVQ